MFTPTLFMTSLPMTAYQQFWQPPTHEEKVSLTLLMPTPGQCKQIISYLFNDYLIHICTIEFNIVMLWRHSGYSWMQTLSKIQNLNHLVWLSSMKGLAGNCDCNYSILETSWYLIPEDCSSIKLQKEDHWGVLHKPQGVLVAADMFLAL